MAVPQVLIDKMKEVDDETTAVGVEVARLRDLVSTSMTAEDVATVTNGLDAIETRLKGIAADPNNPVPPTP